MKLTAREQQLLGLIAQGLDTGQMARTLHISTGTVGKTRTKMFRKLGASNAPHAVAIGYDLALIPREDT